MAYNAVAPSTWVPRNNRGSRQHDGYPDGASCDLGRRDRPGIDNTGCDGARVEGAGRRLAV